MDKLGITQKLFIAIADERGDLVHPDAAEHFVNGEMEALAATSPSAMQIAQEVCAVVAFLHADVCPLVAAKKSGA